MTVEAPTIRSSNPLTVFLTSKGFVFVLRLFLGGLFLYSSIHKIQSPAQFAIAIREYQMLPIGMTNIFALFLAWSEAVAGIMLIFGVMTRKTAGAVLLMLVMFTVAISYTMFRGIAIDCGCFSNEGGHQTDFTLVIRNLFLIVVTIMVMLFDRGSWGLSGAFSRRP